MLVHYDRIDQAMQEVNYVIHAAALKQVPAAEYNPMECIKTNIHGAENIIRSAIKNRVAKVATKLVSDKLFVAVDNMVGKNPTRFSVVRYGNVVGSRCSVVPFFKKLLSVGVAVLPVTHPDMTHFWITIQKGVDFVLKNFERMLEGEIFVPEIPSMRILDLVKSFGSTIDVNIIGIRLGEKLHEVMCPVDDFHHTLKFMDHFVIRPSIVFHNTNNNSIINGLGERGNPVELGFEYNSGTNSRFLTVDELREYNNTEIQ